MTVAIRTIACVVHVLHAPNTPSAALGAAIEARARAVLEYFVELQTTLLDPRAISACGTNTECIGEVLDKNHVDLELEVSLDAASRPALLALTLIEESERTPIASDAVELAAGTAVPEQVAATIQALLVKAGFVRGGVLRARAKPEDAAITVDAPLATERGHGVYVLAPGSYLVSASREGFEHAARPVVIEVAQETSVELQLAEASSVFDSPWFWIAGAVAVAAVGAAITVSALREETIEPPLRGTDGTTISTLRFP